MTKFETIGVNLQLDAHDTNEAKKAFKHSCDCCCSTGRYSKCNNCAISYTHNLMMAYFADRERTK